EIGALVAKIDTSVQAPAESGDTGEVEKEEVEEQKEAAPAEEKAESGVATYASGHPSPSAKRILEEKGIDPSDVSGSGKDGRITKEDAQKAQKQEEKTPSPAKEPEQPAQFVSKKDFSREERKERMSRMRRTIARRLVSAKNNTAMLTTFNEADMSAIMKLRKQYQDKFVDEFGIELGIMSVFAKASARALMEMPAVNSRIEDDYLVYHDYVDISIAISAPNGLVVPPVHNVESLDFHEIELRIKEL